MAIRIGATHVLALVACLALLAGCQPASRPAEPETKPAIPTANTAPKAPTPEEWTAALRTAYVESQVKDQGNGVTSFVACFDRPEKKCGAFSLASRDAFRKLRHFKSGLWSSTLVGTYVASYVALRDNSAPTLFLTAYFFAKHGWLFMHRVAVMVDGEVVLDRDFEQEKVDRDNHSYGVEERFDFVPTEAEIAALRKVTPAGKVMIRLTGSKGYVHLKADDVEHFKSEIQNILLVYDTLSKALAGHTLPQ